MLRAGHVGVVHRLLAADADVNTKNNDGATALMLATYAQKEGVVRVLISSGARQGLSAALAFAEQAGAAGLAGILRDTSPASSSSIGMLGWVGRDHLSESGFSLESLGFLPLGAPYCVAICAARVGCAPCRLRPAARAHPQHILLMRVRLAAAFCPSPFCTLPLTHP